MAARTKIGRNLCTGLGFAVLTFLFVNPARGQVRFLLDDFEVSQDLLSIGGPTTGQNSSVVDGPMLGGERDVIINLKDAASLGDMISYETSNGVANYSQMGNAGGSLFIIYDGNDNSGDTLRTEGLGGMDLTNGGSQSAFEVTILSSSAQI